MFSATLPFDADDGDHFETSRAAYEDVIPLLRCAARQKARRRNEPVQGAEAKLRIYDPYFCSGRMKSLLAELGFPRVTNRKRDFYADVAAGHLPKFDVLLTNPPYSGDHKERLFNFVLERQRRASERNVPEPFLILLPSWSMGKAFAGKFISRLAGLTSSRQDDGLELNTSSGIFYVCRRGPDGRPEKYSFDHIEGAGLARCPFFGVWICGGFGGASATQKAMRRVARGVAEGFWTDDASWYLCRPGLEGTVDWCDGTKSDSVELRGGHLVFDSLAGLQAAGLVRSVEDVRTRMRENPKQNRLRQKALEALDKQRAALREARGGKRKRGVDRREYVTCANAAPVPITNLPTVCRHFFSAKGCSRGDKCRFAHKVGD